MKKKFFILYSLAILIVLLLGITASAAPLTGVRWANGNIRYSCTSTMSSLNRSYVASAASSWSSSTNANLSSGSGATFDEINQSALAWDGYTTYGKSRGYVTSTWTNINAYYTNGYSGSKTLGVISHEMGHVLCLNEEYSTTVSVMVPRTASRNYTTPQSIDIKNVNSIY